jgi:MFS family permease
VYKTYRAILSRPGAANFAFAGLLARVPISTFNLSVILLVQIQYGQWEIAGRVAAVGVIVWALQTMPTARWIDRSGQRRMIPLTVLFVIGAVIVAATAMTRGPEWLLWLGVALGSFTGPLGALTRARWSHILDNDDDIHTAFSLEGALDEVLFVAGPALITWLAYTVHPASGLLLATVGMTVGITLLLARTDTEPPPSRGTGATGLGLRVPAALVAVALSAVALGAMFGAFDISTVAFATEAGHEDWGGAVLGIISAGSFVGGLVYGSRRWRTPLWGRFVVTAVLLGIGFSILSFMPTLVAYTAVGFVAGMAIAPVLTSQDSVIQRLVKQSQLIEGMAWLRVGLGIGVAFGSWYAGRLIDAGGHRSGLWLVAGAAAGVAVIALGGAWWVRRDTLRARQGVSSEITVTDFRTH